ncbi:MAG: hypothetical protein QNJ55_27200 [Xenococcus sp. MO_188.B8]|nr:hypothetical protein [Xenococcus sp. MO_188.B8]
MIINLNVIGKSIIILSCIIVLINNNNKELLASAREENSESGKSAWNLDFEKISEEVEKEFDKKNELIERQRNLLIEQIDHEIWKIKFYEKSFEWQFASSIIILFIVIIIVIAGLYFSYIQFTKSFKQGNENSENKEIKETTIKIGTGEMEISSSVIGLIILTLSFAFFYLYITNVFPLEELGLTKIEQEQKEEKTETEDKQ